MLAQKYSKSAVVDDIADIKDFKKLLRTRINVLVLFAKDKSSASGTIKVFNEAASHVKGQGTMVLMDCSNRWATSPAARSEYANESSSNLSPLPPFSSPFSDVKKICKKLKVSPSPETLKHYKDGEFHKDYDRRMVVQSMVTFMKDPAGDLPWDEDPAGADVLHFQDGAALEKFLKKEKRPSLIMFYAPWCGYCKQMKPDYSKAAAELKPDYIIAAIDVNKPENAIVRRQYNISGFPTILYYENGQYKFTYEGDKKKQDIVDFMKNPTAKPAEKEEEPDWAESSSDIVHLTASSFEAVLKDEKAALIMFYAPWCGHCKKMKPVYERAAEAMKAEKISGMLAALDATKEPSVASQFGVKGYPTFKFFEHGEFKFDVNHRDLEGIVKFMRNPEEPPPPPPPEKEWEDEPSEVQHLNTDNYKTFLKKKKNVLVMFYAPWCGHCKKAKPEFDKAAETFKDDPKIELAAVDCTKHREVCSANDVQGYPTIKYFSYYKTKLEYNGGRVAEDFVKYLKRKSELGADAEDEAAPPKAEVGFGEFKGSEHVIKANDKNFHEILKTHKTALVFFYASCE